MWLRDDCRQGKKATHEPCRSFEQKAVGATLTRTWFRSPVVASFHRVTPDGRIIPIAFCRAGLMQVRQAPRSGSETVREQRQDYRAAADMGRVWSSHGAREVTGARWATG